MSSDGGASPQGTSGKGPGTLQSLAVVSQPSFRALLAPQDLLANTIRSEVLQGGPRRYHLWRQGLQEGTGGALGLQAGLRALGGPRWPERALWAPVLGRAAA